MSYNEIKTPRFFIDISQFYNVTKTGTSIDKYFGLNPHQTNNFDLTSFGVWYKSFKKWAFDDAPIPKINYVAALGHNFADLEGGGFQIRLDNYQPGNEQVDYFEPADDTEGYNVYNADFSTEMTSTGLFTPKYNGSSIARVKEQELPANANRVTIRLGAKEGGLGTTYTEGNNTYMTGLNVNCLSMGYIYEMPVAANATLTRSIEYQKQNEIISHTGKSFSNTLYTRPPLWNNVAPFELYSSNPDSEHWIQGDGIFSRNGRKRWNLTFSAVQDSDMYGPNQMLSKQEYTDISIAQAFVSLGYDSADVFSVADDNLSMSFRDNVLEDDNWFSQVWSKTLGGSMSFIFQPDKSDNSQFALCRFKESSFKARLVAPKLYEFSVDIEETF